MVQLAAQPVSPREMQLALTLQRLLAIDATEALEDSLLEAASLAADGLGADRVNVLVYEPASAALIALTAPDLQRGRRRRGAAASRYPLRAGGLPVGVFRTGTSILTGRVDREPGEWRRHSGGHGNGSELLCPLKVRGAARGVLHAVSSDLNHFTQSDLRFLEAVARWMGLVMQSVEAPERRSERAALPTLAAGAGATLTQREREVAVLVASGLTNKEIARELVLVPGTVSNHVLHILRKLGFTRRAQIATWVTRQGLSIPTPSQTGSAAELRPPF